MSHSISYVLLYVKDVPKSQEFYETLLGCKSVESAPTFALFVLPNGLKFGLWKRDEVEPKVSAQSGANEVCIEAGNVDAVYQEWKQAGVTIAQKPTTMDFGYTFVALDLDGHRVRVFKLADNPR